MYEFGKFLGWVNASLLFLVIALFPVRKLLPPTNRLLLFLRRVHRWSALLLVVSALTHSFLVWGIPQLHSGHFLFATILFAILVAWLGPRIKLPVWFLAHLFLALAAIELFVWHVW